MGEKPGRPQIEVGTTFAYRHGCKGKNPAHPDLRSVTGPTRFAVASVDGNIAIITCTCGENVNVFTEWLAEYLLEDRAQAQPPKQE